MHRACSLAVISFAILYALALGLFIVGTFGLFGSPSGPLAGIFLMPIGLPWNHMIDVFPEPLWPPLAALTPALNLAILVLICRYAASRRAARQG
jgi:hypothetical protein